ncbi:hypothetical protein HID58_004345 [Brassica napus]|uniref:Uncharacterized protein n=1 Tax=Brassica napus TaxID=3708 RepID=A0ABQ8E5I7_BRANA|nr:hypothetical protein HID58_004345 [Brassica napus]
MLGCLDELATKFVKIISTDCIPNYPDCKFSVGRRCTPESVALVLCQSEPVLNDGKSGDDDSSREAVMAGVRRQFIERVVKDYEDKDTDDDDYNSD